MNTPFTCSILPVRQTRYSRRECGRWHTPIAVWRWCRISCGARHGRCCIPRCANQCHGRTSLALLLTGVHYRVLGLVCSARKALRRIVVPSHAPTAVHTFSARPLKHVESFASSLLRCPESSRPWRCEKTAQGLLQSRGRWLKTEQGRGEGVPLGYVAMYLQFTYKLRPWDSFEDRTVLVSASHAACILVRVHTVVDTVIST